MSFGLAAVRDCLFDSLAAVAGVFELVKIDVVGHRLRSGKPHGRAACRTERRKRSRYLRLGGLWLLLLLLLRYVPGLCCAQLGIVENFLDTFEIYSRALCQFAKAGSHMDQFRPPHRISGSLGERKATGCLLT